MRRYICGAEKKSNTADISSPQLLLTFFLDVE